MVCCRKIFKSITKACTIFLIVFLASSIFAGNVKDFGAVGNGMHDGTKAILEAVTHCDDGLVVFPKGQYRIAKTIEINLSQTGRIGLTGKGGSATIIMNGKGVAFLINGSHDGRSDPNSISEEVWKNRKLMSYPKLKGGLKP